MQAQTANKLRLAPAWYKRFWVGLFGLHGIVEIICICISIATGTLYGLYIYYHFLNVLSLITCGVSIGNLLMFRKYLVVNKAKAKEHCVDAASITRLRHARIRTDVVVFLFIVGFFGALYFEYIIISTESEESWKDSTFYQTPILNDTLSYLEHYASAIIIAALLIVWLNVPIDCKTYQLSQNSLLFSTILCMMKISPPFKSFIMERTNYQEKTAPKSKKSKQNNNNKKNKDDKTVKLNNNNNNKNNSRKENGRTKTGQSSPRASFKQRTSVLIDDIVSMMDIDHDINPQSPNSDIDKLPVSAATPETGSQEDTDLAGGDVAMAGVRIDTMKLPQAPKTGLTRIASQESRGSSNKPFLNDDDNGNPETPKSTDELSQLDDLIDEIVGNDSAINLDIGIDVETHEVEVELDMDGMRMISYSPMAGDDEHMHDVMSDDDMADFDVGELKMALFASNNVPSDGEDENFNVDSMYAGGMADSVVEINDKERNLDMLNFASNSTNQVPNQNFIKDVSLNRITYDGQLKGKRNRNKVRKIDIKIMDRNSIVQSQQTFVALRVCHFRFVLIFVVVVFFGFLFDFDC